jgi:pentatricopeptide repeat protein
MKAYTTNKDMEKATALLRKMESDPKIQPVQVTYNTYLHCAFRSNNYEFAWTFFKNLKSKDIFTYSISNLYLLKKGLSLNLGMIKEVLESYELVKKSGFFIDQVFYNILINGLMKQKAYKEAYLIW